METSTHCPNVQSNDKAYAQSNARASIMACKHGILIIVQV